MKFYIFSILICLISFTVQAQITWDMIPNSTTFGKIECDELKVLLQNDDLVCLQNLNAHANITKVYIENCNLVIHTNHVFKIQNLMTLELRGNSNITLESNSELKGENHGGSKILHSGDGAGIIMNGANAKVGDLAISGGNSEADSDNKQGLEINGEENEVSAVDFDHLESGIIVNSDGNTFYDLRFHKVAIYENCDPAWPGRDLAAIKLVGVNDNELYNAIHGDSPGAVSLWFNEICDNNIVLNIVVDPGKNICEPNQATPSIYFDNEASKHNTITNMLNGGAVIADPPICTFNRISNFQGITCNPTNFPVGTGVSCN